MKCPYCRKEMIPKLPGPGWECTNAVCTLPYKIGKQEKKIDRLNQRLHELRVDRAGTTTFGSHRKRLDQKINDVRTEIEVDNHILANLKDKLLDSQLNQ